MSASFRNICIKVSTGLISLLFFQLSFAQYDFSEVGRKIEASQKELGKNVAAIIYKDGKIIYKKEAGECKINTQAPIASCSKWLTTALVMTFVDQGKLSLDDKVSAYLPIFAKYGKAYITIRQCVSHLTGIQAEQGVARFMERNKYATLEDEVNAYASKREIENNPGVEFRYSNVGLNIAARVLEVISKKQFEQLMNERIFRPLNMRNSSFFSTRAVNPSGGAVSTAADYMNFLSMILNKGLFNGKRILSEKSIEEMEKPQTNLQMIKYAPKVAEGYNYALGEWVLEVDANGNSTAVSSPGLFGTWPFVDKCRGYACIFFVKSLLSEQKKEVYVELKKAIDEVIPSNCK